MQDFETVLSAAQALPAQERLRLIDALWESVPPNEESPFSREWAEEIERRVDEIDRGAAQLISWTTIRAEALARIGHGKGD